MTTLLSTAEEFPNSLCVQAAQEISLSFSVGGQFHKLLPIRKGARTLRIASGRRQSLSFRHSRGDADCKTQMFTVRHARNGTCDNGVGIVHLTKTLATVAEYLILRHLAVLAGELAMIALGPTQNLTVELTNKHVL
jgi:hypothetical protein